MRLVQKKNYWKNETLLYKLEQEFSPFIHYHSICLEKNEFLLSEVKFKRKTRKNGDVRLCVLSISSLHECPMVHENVLLTQLIFPDLRFGQGNYPQPPHLASVAKEQFQL